MQRAHLPRGLRRRRVERLERMQRPLRWRHHGARAFHAAAALGWGSALRRHHGEHELRRRRLRRGLQVGRLDRLVPLLQGLQWWVPGAGAPHRAEGQRPGPLRGRRRQQPPGVQEVQQGRVRAEDRRHLAVQGQARRCARPGWQRQHRRGWLRTGAEGRRGLGEGLRRRGGDGADRGAHVQRAGLLGEVPEVHRELGNRGFAD
mmetsp:Transcript_87073/g.221777  ORF Transcript_87073/g.221777 Transcript_87073/m.221777 type:complete len:203 (+) Transcript_87073:1111-1719(+)